MFSKSISCGTSGAWYYLRMNIVFDIGGTNMRVASAVGDVLGEIRKVPTPPDPIEGIKVFTTLAHKIAGESIEHAAGSIAADRIDENGVLHGARKLTLWNETPFIKDLSDALAAPVTAANDGIIVGLGELRKGGGRGFQSIAYITVSTGVGGALMTGEDDIGTAPILGELTLGVGSLEDQISGTAITKKFGIHPKELDSLEERNKLADILAAGLSEIAAFWKPHAFVIGGSMIVGVNPIPLERVREKFTAVPVKMAELGDNGGLIGGAILAMQTTKD